MIYGTTACQWVNVSLISVLPNPFFQSIVDFFFGNKEGSATS